jgi:wyosine [tRNA(Phe)-imidazoG37] synthetase (radical SAM superfamily)
MNDASDIDPIADHRRSWRTNRYIYPVISRRARGLSIGVNLNPDQVCNFDCVYCEVHRAAPAPTEPVDLRRLRAELDAMLERVKTGRIWADPPFDAVAPALRRVNDIAFSGDGEPTCRKNFPAAVEAVAQAKAAAELDDAKIVLITNATRLHGAPFRSALPILRANNGEIWAKLDAGTPWWYRRMNRSAVPLNRIIANLTDLAIATPIVIQSMFLTLAGSAAPASEITAYILQLRKILEAGGKIKLVQAYTVARPPAESDVGPLSDADLDAVADRIRGALPGVAVETFYSAGAGG